MTEKVVPDGFPVNYFRVQYFRGIDMKQHKLCVPHPQIKKEQPHLFYEWSKFINAYNKLLEIGTIKEIKNNSNDKSIDEKIFYLTKIHTEYTDLYDSTDIFNSLDFDKIETFVTFQDAFSRNKNCFKIINEFKKNIQSIYGLIKSALEDKSKKIILHGNITGEKEESIEEQKEFRLPGDISKKIKNDLQIDFNFLLKKNLLTIIDDKPSFYEMHYAIAFIDSFSKKHEIRNYGKDVYFSKILLVQGEPKESEAFNSGRKNAKLEHYKKILNFLPHLVIDESLP